MRAKQGATHRHSKAVPMIAEHIQYEPDDAPDFTDPEWREHFYTPRKLADLYKQLGPDDPDNIRTFYTTRRSWFQDLGTSVQTNSPWQNPNESKAIIVGDLLWALEKIGLFERQIIEYCVVGLVTQREFAEYHGIDERRVSEYKRQGLENAAWALGWRPPEDQDSIPAQERQRRQVEIAERGLVWRKDDTEMIDEAHYTPAMLKEAFADYQGFAATQETESATKMDIDRALEWLKRPENDPQAAQVLYLSALQYKQIEIANALNVTQSYVSQLKKRGLERMAAYLNGRVAI